MYHGFDVIIQGMLVARFRGIVIADLHCFDKTLIFFSFYGHSTKKQNKVCKERSQIFIISMPLSIGTCMSSLLAKVYT